MFKKCSSWHDHLEKNRIAPNGKIFDAVQRSIFLVLFDPHYFTMTFRHEMEWLFNPYPTCLTILRVAHVHFIAGVLHNELESILCHGDGMYQKDQALVSKCHSVQIDWMGQGASGSGLNVKNKLKNYFRH